METQYIYKDEARNEKARLIRKSDNWFICEFKALVGGGEWMPSICGTRDFLCLTALDLKWAIDKRR